MNNKMITIPYADAIEYGENTSALFKACLLYTSFINQAVTVLQTLVIALGAGLAVMGLPVAILGAMLGCWVIGSRTKASRLSSTKASG